MVTLRKKLTSLLKKIRKPLSSSPAKTRGKAPRVQKSPKGDTRHDLGKAQLKWGPWKPLGSGRFVRYGTGLNGDNEGAIVIKLFAERDGANWTWAVTPDNDYGSLLPRKYQSGIEGRAANADRAKSAAETAVGLQ
jgi:hypothetical protein